MDEGKIFISRKSPEVPARVRRDFRSFKKTVQSMFGRETKFYYETRKNGLNRSGK